LAEEREKGAADRLARAHADWEVAAKAADACRLLAANHAEYERCERDLAALADQQSQRDEIRAERNELDLLRTAREGELKGIDVEIARAVKALEDIAQAEERIPLQVAAELQVQEARQARQEALELQARHKEALALALRAKERRQRAVDALAVAQEQRPIALDLRRRQEIHAELASSLQTALRAEGQLGEIQVALKRDQRRA